MADDRQADRLAALRSNAEAVRAMARAVEGTIGPRGLDAMLVDRHGGVVVTNDGLTILTEMEATHPAARMVVGAAQAQERAVGDGTTTATIMAGALVTAAVREAARGVPVARLVAGVCLGVERAVAAIRAMARPLAGLEDPLLARVALVAARGDVEVAGLVVAAARLWGAERLLDPSFSLSECVLAREGATSQVFPGVAITRGRLDRLQPRALRRVRALVLDDALEPEEVAAEALSTPAGFRQYQANREAFLAALGRLVDLGVNLILCDRGVDDEAAQFLTDRGVMVLPRVALAEWQRAAEHLGARPVRRAALRKDAAELRRYLGRAQRAEEDEALGLVRITGGAGRPMATVLVGAATPEVAAERERIARDAAAAVQAAVRGGVVPGGGAAELAAARAVAALREEVAGLEAYGVSCVAEALREPLMRIVANAGWNPLEKVEQVWAAQAAQGAPSLAVDCDTGQVADMWAAGVVDPALVKEHAIRAAGEIAAAILRIDTVVRRRSAGDGWRGAAARRGRSAGSP